MAGAVTARKEQPPAKAHGFRRLVTVAKIGEAGLVQSVTASPAELAKIADYLDLVAVRALKAEVTLARWRAKGIRATGTFEADVTQSCVVTLDPLEARVEGAFERRFLPDLGETDEPDVFVEPEGEDPPESLGREIDLGEILVEELSLGLDPYPRKPGAELETAAEGQSAPREKSPFAALAKLKPKLEKK